MRSPASSFSIRVFLLFLAFGGPGSAHGEDATAAARVAVLPFSNETGSAACDAACGAATETLALTLRQLERYVVQSEDKPSGGEAGLRALADDLNLDFIMYGTMSPSKSGAIECSLSVFDRAKKKTTLSRSLEAEGAPDIAGTADTLIVSALGSMTRTHFGLGAIRFKNTGEEGDYRVLVDGYPAGRNLESLDKVVSGQRTVAIAQMRMGSSRTIASSKVVVKEGATVEFDFAVPSLLEDERAKLDALVAAIKSGWNDEAAADDVDAKTKELSSLLGDASASPKLAEYKNEATQLDGEWAQRRIRYEIEKSAWEPRPELLDAGLGSYEDAASYPDPGRIRAAFEENARLLETLIELKAGKALCDDDYKEGLECFENALLVSKRRLGGERAADCESAITALKDFEERAGKQGAGETDESEDPVAFLGGLMMAGQRFYDLREKVEAGKACALVASDFAARLSVDGGDPQDAPLALSPAAGSRAVNVRPQGADGPVALTVAAGERLLFAQDGLSSFGEASGGTALGSIRVEVNRAGARVSLDDDARVDAPHLFESVAPGAHTISIGEMLIGGKIYPAVEKSVVVEAGKRSELRQTLEAGRAKLRLGGLPEGSTLLVDDAERPLAADADGGMAFEGPIEAGISKIEVVRGNTTWSMDAHVSIDGTTTRNLKDMAALSTLQRRELRLQGKADDWAGIDPIFKGSGFTKTPTIPGSRIAGGSLCRDGKYLYVKIDFADGKPLMVPRSIRQLSLYQDSYRSQHVNLEVDTWPDGTIHPGIWVEKERQFYPAGSYVAGASFIEMKFPISWFSGYFDFSKPIRAKLQFFFANDYGPTANYSNTIEIIVGK
jgi:hypothetical protein